MSDTTAKPGPPKYPTQQPSDPLSWRNKTKCFGYVEVPGRTHLGALSRAPSIHVIPISCCGMYWSKVIRRLCCEHGAIVLETIAWRARGI